MKQLLLLISFMAVIILSEGREVSGESPIVFIYDASGSMLGKMEGRTKMDIASEVLLKTVEDLADRQTIGLVAYGHRQKDDCRDVEFLVEMEAGTKSMIRESLSALKPVGKTPLAYTADLVIDKLRKAGKKATIILVTDGIESCDGNICDVVTTAKKEGVNFKMHIIGFGLKAGEAGQLKCAADAAGGHYYDAANASGLGEVLQEATAATVDKPAGNVTIYTIKNNKPVDAHVIATNSGTKKVAGRVRTYGDTADLYLPAGVYELKVTPLEGTDIDAITVKDVKSFGDRITHQTVSFDGGKFRVMTLNNDEGWDAMVKIIDPSTKKVIASGRTYGKADMYEVNPGIYDIELTALNIDGLHTKELMKNVAAASGSVTHIDHKFKSGIAMIGVKTAGELVDASVNIKDAATKENITSRRTYTSGSSNPKKFILNPGTYEVAIVALGKHKGNNKTITIEVVEGKTTEKIIVF